MTDYEVEMSELIEKRTKLGKLCISLYAEPCDSGYWAEEDTFASEVLYRVGYEIGHWYQDLDDYRNRPERYPDGITPRMIANAERWVREAEKVLGTGRQEYFGGGTF